MGRSFLVAVFLIFLSLSNVYCEEIRAMDTNGDGVSDKWFYNEGRDLVKMEEDLNFDGTVDKRANFFYQQGEKNKVEIDSNMDGRADGWSYHRDGVRYRIESDTNYDGIADYVIDNVAHVTMIDSDYDGNMDIKDEGRYRFIDSDLNGTFKRKEEKKTDLEHWLAQERVDYSSRLQQYMKNTDYKHKSGLE